ncbi:hypothetical protein FD755_025290 [Muntiacus reevesi]|uniref:Mos1 transposase HTH domain-containing protein n=1 Tax=Muntiacus reevesi TaxID=9886 RepID=A0A5N3UNK9_MUNRE|nr:hypothetical protein FD755_025290 [Muntiacus reevesi]
MKIKQSIFLFEFKMGRKAVDTTHNINNAFDRETANKHTVQWWFKKFCKGDESLENEEHSGWPLEVDNNQYQKLNVDHSVVIWHLKQIGKVKKLDKWVTHKLTANQKSHHLEVSSSLFLCNNKLLLDWTLSDWTKKKLQSTSKSQTCTKNSLIHYSFLNSSETITSEKKGRILLHNNTQLHSTQPMLHKLNEFGCEVSPHLPYSPDLSPTNYHFFKHLDNLLQGKCFHNHQETENAFQKFSESQSTDFYATGINKLISHWQKYVDCNGSYFD